MADRATASLSLVIPAYNERTTIDAIMRRSLAVLQSCATDFELVVLDDASTDDTFAIMGRVAAVHPRIRVARHDTNRGIAATFEDLYRLASKDFVFLISGDGQFPPETLRDCVPLLDTCDIVICRRVVKQYTPYRQLVSFCYRWMPRLLFGVDVIDPGGIKCVRKTIIDSIPVRSTSVFVEAERVIRAAKRGYRLGTVDMTPVPREGGQATGARLGSVIGAGLDMLRCWFRVVVRRQI